LVDIIFIILFEFADFPLILHWVYLFLFSLLQGSWCWKSVGEISKALPYILEIAVEGQAKIKKKTIR